MDRWTVKVIGRWQRRHRAVKFLVAIETELPDVDVHPMEGNYRVQP